MTIGRLVATPEEARPTFRALRALSERLRAGEPRLGAALSMGMSDDYPVAVEEGATMPGRAIFGERRIHTSTDRGGSLLYRGLGRLRPCKRSSRRSSG